MSLVKKLKGYAGTLRRKLFASVGIDPVTGLRLYNYPMEKLGSVENGWYVPMDLLSRGAVCYCIGAGEDISFDLGLLDRGCDVYTFDPTPRAIAYVQSIGKTNFFPFGAWSENVTKRFYAPKDPAHVSHSILNLQKSSEYFDAECKTIATLMRSNGHTSLALLKLDIEGAEYEVIDSILRDNITIGVLCVEFDEMHHALDADRRKRIRQTARSLAENGYRLSKMEISNFTFVHSSLSSPL